MENKSIPYRGWHWLRDIREPTILTDRSGHPLGVWTPIGYKPQKPPEPPESAAAVGALVPSKPLTGGPGVAVIPDDARPIEEQDWYKNAEQLVRQYHPGLLDD